MVNLGRVSGGFCEVKDTITKGASTTIEIWVWGIVASMGVNATIERRRDAVTTMGKNATIEFREKKRKRK